MNPTPEMPKGLPTEIAEEMERAAENYVRAKHAKEQRHFENPEKWGPLPPLLEQESYMFMAGCRFTYALMAKRVEAYKSTASGYAEGMFASAQDCADQDQRIAELELELKILKNPSNGRCMEIANMRERIVELTEALKEIVAFFELCENSNIDVAGPSAFGKLIERARAVLKENGQD